MVIGYAKGIPLGIFNGLPVPTRTDLSRQGVKVGGKGGIINDDLWWFKVYGTFN